MATILRNRPDVVVDPSHRAEYAGAGTIPEI